jgi:outer membrane protein OmpA-like peptidoglycan-associated protein
MNRLNAGRRTSLVSLAAFVLAGPALAADAAPALPKYVKAATAGLTQRQDKYEHAVWDQLDLPPWGDLQAKRSGERWHLLLGFKGVKDNLGGWKRMQPKLTAAGWTVVKVYMTQPLIGFVHYQKDGVEAWGAFSMGDAEYGNFDVIRVSEPAGALTLAAPGRTPEIVEPAKGDFPYLAPLKGSKFKNGTDDQGAFTVTMPGSEQAEIVAPTMIVKNYGAAEGTSNAMFVYVYHTALLAAGWTIVREANGADAAITAHYAKNGRNIWAYLHFAGDGYSLAVGDAGLKDLSAALDKDCHVALTGLLFDFNKATLKPESDPVLQKVLILLGKNPSLKLEVQGHTDAVGDAAYNQNLSQARAAAVVDWLTKHGIAAARLTPKGYGKSMPVADNNSDAGRAKNRRVELVKPGCAPSK